MAVRGVSVLLTLLLVLCVAVVFAAAAAGGNKEGWYKIKLERDFKKGAQPFNGKGHKSPKKLPIDPRTGMVYTGSLNRSQEWYALTPLVAIDEKNIQVWEDRPVPLSISHLINDGTVDPDIENDTTVITNVTCNRGGKHCQVVNNINTSTNMAPQQVRISEHRVTQHGDRREHVLTLSTVTGSCGVTASLTFTPDATTFSLLFNNFNVAANKVNVLQQSRNCAFRVPIIVPMGLTVAALTSKLRGYALSSPRGQAGIAWTAGIGSTLDPNAWADIYNTGSYSARYWSGGVQSGADFDPITVAMELDSQDPTFSPCGKPCANCAKTYSVPVDFQFTLNAVRTAAEAQMARPPASLIYLDSQDTSKSITMNQPYDFELC